LGIRLSGNDSDFIMTWPGAADIFKHQATKEGLAAK
jgi:hypothetical protein